MNIGFGTQASAFSSLNQSSDKNVAKVAGKTSQGISKLAKQATENFLGTITDMTEPQLSAQQSQFNKTPRIVSSMGQN